LLPWGQKLTSNNWEKQSLLFSGSTKILSLLDIAKKMPRQWLSQADLGQKNEWRPVSDGIDWLNSGSVGCDDYLIEQLLCVIIQASSIHRKLSPQGEVLYGPSAHQCIVCACIQLIKEKRDLHAYARKIQN
jgi:hypothetical protein